MAEAAEITAINSRTRRLSTGHRLPSRAQKYTVQDFLFGQTLGQGSYSTVVICRERSSNLEFAAKILDKKHIVKENKVKYVNVEKMTLSRLRDHPGVVRLHCTFQDPRSLCKSLFLA